MTEEDASANKAMRFFASESFNLLSQLIVHARTTKTVDQFVIVNTCILRGLNQEGSDLILIFFFSLAV